MSPIANKIILIKINDIREAFLIKGYYSLLALLLLSALNIANAQSTPMKGAAYDCTGIDLAEVDPYTLSEAERLQLMEESFFDSLDQFSSCISNVQGEMAGGEGQGNGSQQGTGSNGSMEQQVDEIEPEPIIELEPKVTTPPNGAGPKMIPPKDNASAICKLLFAEIQKESNERTKARLTQEYERYRCR